jgi:hypothetical protein
MGRKPPRPDRRQMDDEPDWSEQEHEDYTNDDRKPHYRDRRQGKNGDDWRDTMKSTR